MLPQSEDKVSVDQEGVRWRVRAVAKIEAVLLILVLLSLGFEAIDSYESTAISTGLFFYAAIVLGIQYPGSYRTGSRWIVAVQTWAMIPFITWAIWFTDKLASPLRNAYLLVIIASALTVSMRTTMCQLALIAVCIVLTGEIWSADVLFSLGNLSELVARLTPLIIVAYVTSMFSSDIRYGMRKARLLWEIDEVTGLYNIRGFAIVADRLFAHAMRDKHPTSVLMIDIDNVNAIRQVHGYEAGNDLLWAIANCIDAELRHDDGLACYRDYEFVAVLHETTARGALDIAERIRGAVAAVSVTLDETTVTTTVSIGLAGYDGTGPSIDAVLARAENAMHIAKEQGGNRIVTLPA